MSTRTTQSNLLHESQSPKQNASQSALHYLFQEVSKLASPIHNSFMETDSMWISSKEDVASCLCPSAHESVPHRPLTTAGKHVQSPLKVLSLINLQCERLQHPSEDDEAGHGSLLFFSDFGFSKQAEELQDSSQPLIYESNSVGRSDSQLKKDFKNSEDRETTKSSIIFPFKAEAAKNTVDALQMPALQFSVGLDLSSDWTKECLSTQHTFYDFLPEAKAPCPDKHLTFSPNEKCATETLLPLDHNANICLNPDEPYNGPLESVDSQPCSSHEQPPPNIQVNTVSTCEDSSEEIPTPHPVERSDENSELTSIEKDNSALCEGQRSLWRSKRRKQPRPSRSASVQDPDFQGVTFRMDTELDDTKEQCRLLITSKYSTDLPKSLKRTRLRTRTSQKSLKTSSDEDSDLAASEAKDKVCASCCTKKTPMWRDAEDGTPLCNACGIRYKKYRVRCINCWNIPKKDGNSVSRCSKCGHFVRLTSAQRRPTV